MSADGTTWAGERRVAAAPVAVRVMPAAALAVRIGPQGTMDAVTSDAP